MFLRIRIEEDGKIRGCKLTYTESVRGEMDRDLRRLPLTLFLFVLKFIFSL